MPMNIQLVSIDAQHDFCHPNGSLFVPGADKDIERLAEFVRRATPVLTDINETLDAHQRLHIAHPEFVVDGKGLHPAPFTMITREDAKKGKYRAANPDLQGLWVAYIEALETNGRYPYVIWPPHCPISGLGGSLVPELLDAFDQWALRKFATVNYVPKGSSWRTEHYSAVRADVPDPSDPTTQLNVSFISALEKADMLIWAGQASSHCVPNTYKDVADAFGDPTAITKMVLLSDCQSPVPGFEKVAEDAINEMQGRGMRVMTSVQLLKELGC